MSKKPVSSKSARSKKTNSINAPDLEGDVNAIYEYGVKLFKGDGLPMNKKEASRYLKVAADKENSDAMLMYGLMLYKGDGIPINEEEGEKYIEKAVKQDNNDAMYIFGQILKKKGGISERVRAYACFKLAANNGSR